MSTVQIATLTTDRSEDVSALADQWWSDTEGRRTIQREEIYVDPADPQTVVSLNYFASAADQQTNNDLPETQQFAEKAAKLALTEPTFTDLKLIAVKDARVELGQRLRAVIEGGSPEGLVSADVDFDMVVPHARYRTTGPESIVQTLAEDAPGHRVDTWDVQATERGFLVESVYRTTGLDVEYVSMSTYVGTVENGMITRLLIQCGGNWQPELVASVVERTGALGVRADGSEVRS